MKNLLERLEFTGRFTYEDKSESLFTHLILSEKEFEEINNGIGIDSFAMENDIDLISVKYNGPISFMHFTDIENEESIDEKGLIIQEDKFIMDMGRGIYCIEEDDETGFDNLYDYFDGCEKDGSDKVLKIIGSYNGEYLRCEYGDGHEHYILLKENIPSSKLILEEVSFEEEFGFYSFN